MKYVEICTNALNAITSTLSAKEVISSSFLEALKTFEQYKLGLSAADLEQALGLEKHLLQDFMTDLRKLKSYLQVTCETEQSKRNVEIASLRLMDWFGEIAKKIDALNPIVVMNSDDFAKSRGYKQIRAAELVIRSLISETYGSQDKLLKAIRELFKREEIVRKIEKNAESGDVLSGTDFSQLVAIFLNPNDYERYYQPIYGSTPFLDYLKQKRDTLAFFLDDIRRIRNRIAHHRPLTSAQIELLNIYYDQILDPIQSAHDEGRVKVNPDTLLGVSDEELKSYIAGINVDLQEIKEGITGIGTELNWIRRHTKLIIAGVAAVILISLGSAVLIESTRQTALDVKKDTTDIKSDTAEIKTGIRTFDAKLENVKQETSNDPRKELANRGVPWAEKELEAALVRGDMTTVELFVRGGMDPMVSSSNSSAPIAAIICLPDAWFKLEKLKELGVNLQKFYKIYLGNIRDIGRVVTDENLLAGYLRGCNTDDPALTSYLVANGVHLDRTFLENAGKTIIQLPRRLDKATDKPRSVAVLLESNVFDLSVRDGELLSYLFSRNEGGEPFTAVGRDPQCISLAKSKYPALYARLNQNKSVISTEILSKTGLVSQPNQTWSLACHNISMDYPTDLRSCSEQEKDPRYKRYFLRK